MMQPDMSHRFKADNWHSSEVAKLIEAWSDPDIQNEMDMAYRNYYVYEKISKKLQELGIRRTAQQCRVKVKNVKRLFTKFKETAPDDLESLKLRHPFYCIVENVLAQKIFSDADGNNGDASNENYVIKLENNDLQDDEEGEDIDNQDIEDEISTIIKYHESSPSTISNTTESRNQIVIPQMNQRPIPQINQTLIPQIKYHSSSSTKKRKKRSPILYQQEEEEDEEEEPTTSLENGGSAKKPSLDMEIVMDKIEKLQNTFEEGIATLQNQLRDERKFYMECEERRLKFFAELEEKRRRDEREHELKLFKLFTNVQTQNNSREQSSSGQISEPNLLVPNISQCRDTNL